MIDFVFKLYFKSSTHHFINSFDVDKQLLAEVAALCDKVGAQGKAYDLLNDFQKLDQLEYENG